MVIVAWQTKIFWYAKKKIESEMVLFGHASIFLHEVKIGVFHWIFILIRQVRNYAEFLNSNLWIQKSA